VRELNFLDCISPTGLTSECGGVAVIIMVKIRCSNSAGRPLRQVSLRMSSRCDCPRFNLKFYCGIYAMQHLAGGDLENLKENLHSYSFPSLLSLLVFIYQYLLVEINLRLS